MTGSGDMSTTSCRRAVGEGGGGWFQGGPLWLQQASVVPAVIPHPHPPCPHCPLPLPAGHWRGRLAHCRAQPANGRHAAALRDWLGSCLEGAHPSVHPQGGSPWITTHAEIHRAETVQAGWVTEVGAAASAHYGRLWPSPTKHMHTKILFVG